MHRIASPLLGKLARVDLAVVQLLSICASPAVLRFLAITLSRWGNGAIYAVLPVFILLRLGRAGFAVVALSAINIGLLHMVYARLKRRIGRRRPFAVNRDVTSLLDVLDEHSFPSGHVMTLTAALIPLLYADPTAMLYGITLLAAMGWARIASGHHYPTDVIAGAAVAFATGYPLTVLWLG